MQAVTHSIVPNTPAANANHCSIGGIEGLRKGQESEVLAFLAERPIHTVMLSGLIRDNGLVSEFNRGSFYACRNLRGQLEGVMLVGDIVLFEARTESALAAFARVAQTYPNAFMLVGEHEKIARLWAYYGPAGQAPRLHCRELLFELRWPVEVREPVPGLRLATADDLDAVVPVHASMALEESGVDPLVVDPEGFRQRCARRIQQGRVWVWVEDGRLIFKADVISHTPDVIYLEGIYINPAERGNGYGVRCMAELSRELLTHTKSICLLVNEKNRAAQELYRKSHFQHRGLYDTIFLQQQGAWRR